jgi:membrane protease YdiL (CAAX protease family)
MAESSPPRADMPTALALVFAAVLPSFMAWLYFFVLVGSPDPDPVRQGAYGAGKLVQFAFPLVFVWFWQRRRPRHSRPNMAGVALGLGFGLAVAVGVFTLYFGWLRDSPMLEGTPAHLRRVLRSFGVDDGARYLALAVFYVAAHSLLEEYYYRWFLFGRMRAFLSLWPAVVLSSLVFMAHHVILLAAYLPGQFWTAVVPLSLCIAVGGGVWAWLYARTQSLYAPWLSHAIVDASLFAIGWNLLQRGG